MTSRTLFPWICGGSVSSPLRRRYRIAAKTISASTKKKTMTATMKTTW